MSEPDAPAPPTPKQPRYCQDYAITASGKPLAAKWHGEQLPPGDKRFKGIAGWLVSEMSFGPGEEKPLMIRFRSGYPVENWSVSDQESSSAAIFKYRLSTAACWAGTIATGKIILKPATSDPRELTVLKPVNRFKKDGDTWVWEFDNLEPTLADDLEIEVRPAVVRYTPDEHGAAFVERGKRWTLAHFNYTVTASSTLPPEGNLSYHPEHLKSSWNDAAWSEGAAGHGVGEWLEIKPTQPKPLDAIAIWPGYGKTPQLFRANARPKKISIELNGEHRFDANIPDSAEEFRIPVANYHKPVKTLRLTFSEVWPGSQFEDLAISAIQLHAVLDKKPKIGPVR